MTSTYNLFLLRIKTKGLKKLFTGFEILNQFVRRDSISRVFNQKKMAISKLRVHSNNGQLGFSDNKFQKQAIFL